MIFSLILRKHFLALILFFLFGLLLAKNPFSTRNLIANFEPFPDSFYYVTTPRCWLAGWGWRLCRAETEGIKTATMPLYSVVLLPGFILNSDPRVFYFTNVLLSLLGLSIFYLLVVKLFKQKHIQLACLFLYVTSYHLYWLPTLAMAENLLQMLFLLSLWLLLIKDSKKVLFARIFIGASFIATKYSLAPITGIYLAIVAAKSFHKRQVNNILFLILIILILIAFWFFGWITIVTSLAKSMFRGTPNSYFSSYYFVKNFNFYWQAMQGKETTFLWDHRQLYPVWMAVAAALGYGVSIIKKQYVFFISNILLLLAGQIFFMSFFYTADSRYILPIISTGLLGLGFFLSNLHKLYKKINLLNFYYMVLSIIAFIIFSTLLIRIKSQISLNLRYSETPWWYLSVIELNKYFVNTNKNKPIVITAISPYLIDYYSNSNYQLLPLSKQQDFRGHKMAVWGQNDYSDLIALYKSKLDEGKEIYVTNYGLGHEADKIAAFQAIKNTFSLKLVQSGCYDLCNIYKLHL